MHPRSLLLVRRGVQSVHLGLVTFVWLCLVPLMLGAFDGATVLKVLAIGLLTTAHLLVLAGVTLMTAAPRESGVPRWAIGILAICVLLQAWPTVVYAADLPIAALPDTVTLAPYLTTVIHAGLFTGLMARLCRWIADHEPPSEKDAKGRSSWTKQSRRWWWMLGTALVLVWTIWVLSLDSMIFALIDWIGMLAMLVPVVGAVVAVVVAVLWLIAFSSLALGFNRACRRSEWLAGAADGAAGSTDAGRAPWAGLVMGLLALVMIPVSVGGQVVLGRPWRERHAAELKAREEAGEWVEFESEEDDGGGNDAGAFPAPDGTHFATIRSFPSTRNTVGQPAWQAELTMVDGETIRLADLRGKVVVLHLLAETFPGELRQDSDFARFAQDVVDEGGMVLGVSAKDVGTLPRLVKDNRIAYPVASATAWLAGLEDVGVVPETYVIDAEGTIRAEFIHPSGAYDDFRRAFDAAKEPMPPPHVQPIPPAAHPVEPAPDTGKPAVGDP